MKAITLWQPWATLIAIGAKQYETRSWQTSYRGPIAIHAAMRPADYFPVGAVEDIAANANRFPYGAIVATARLVECWDTCPLVNIISIKEKRYGDWRCGRYAWELVDVKPLASPIPVSGKQGLWNWTEAAS